MRITFHKRAVVYSTKDAVVLAQAWPQLHHETVLRQKVAYEAQFMIEKY